MTKGTLIDFIAYAADSEAMLQELVELAQRHGFEFSFDELDDAQLAEASGGVSVTDALAGTDGTAVSGLMENQDFLTLQNALQMETRKFQTLAQASRARHDIATQSVQNTRA